MTIALAGALLLCIATAFLADSEKYLTASVTGALAASALIALVVRYFRMRLETRAQARKTATDTARRTAIATNRREQIDKVGLVVLGAAKAVTGSATEFADIAKAAAAGTGRATVEAAKGISDNAAGLANVAKTGVAGTRNWLGAWRSRDLAD